MEDDEEDYEKTTFVICLRRRVQGHCPMFVTVRTEVRYGGKRPSKGDPIKEAFRRFTRRAREAAPLTKGRRVDVHIGVWGIQPHFTVPKSLTKLMGKHGWSINVVVDD